MEMSECPFCGESPEGFEFGGAGPPPKYRVTCGACGASGPDGYGCDADDPEGAKRDAVFAWNNAPRHGDRPPVNQRG